MIAILAMLTLAQPALPADVRIAQARCVADLYHARTASVGVSDREARLVARLEAEHDCALLARLEVRNLLTALAAERENNAVCAAVAPPLAPSCGVFVPGLVGCALCAGVVGTAAAFAR